jgi:ATP-binding cassette subfamily B protein
MNKKLKYFGIPQIISYVKKYRLMIVVMVVLGALSSLIDTIYPLFNQYAINHYIGQGKIDNLTLFIVSYILFLIAQVFLNYFSSYLCCKVELEVGRDLKNASFNHLQTLSFSYFNTNNVGYVHARIMSDTDRIGTMVSWRLMDIVWNLSYIIFVFVVMSMINVRLALLLLLLVPVAIVFILFFQK